MEPVPLDEDRTAADPGPPRLTATLDGSGGQIADARRLAAGFLTRVRDEHGLHVPARAMDLTQLVVSELVTNARKYAPGPILLELRIAGDAVEVAVWDSDPVLPVPRGADPGRVGQHGLEIVTAVSEHFEVRREPVGKRVTARVALRDDPAGGGAGRAPS